MSNLPAKYQPYQPFDFTFDDQAAVRIIMKANGEPLFVGADVCAALDISNNRDALSRLDDDEKDVAQIYTPGGLQNMVVVNESGLYNLVLGSRKPEAKAFKRWITHEVLPALRKGQLVPSITPMQALLQAVTRMAEQEQILAEHEQRLMAVEVRQTSMEQGSQYFTIMAYATLKGIRLDNGTAQVYGMKASRLSREQGVGIGKVSDQRYGVVGSYHIDILKQVFKE